MTGEGTMGQGNARGFGLLTLGSLFLQAQSPVAMVADCQPKVVFLPGREVKLLDEVLPGKALRLDKGARLVLLHMKTGEELRFEGPAQVRFDAQGNLKGDAPRATRRLPSLQGSPKLKLQGLMPAATLMRGDSDTADLDVHPLGPALLTSTPTFTWQAQGGTTQYVFRLYDHQGKLRFERTLDAPTLTLGTAEALAEGERYTWVVEARGAGVAPVVSSGRVRLLEPGLRDHLARVRPKEGAPFSERVAYAALLEELRVRDEAREYWKAMAAERPESGSLKMLADR